MIDSMSDASYELGMYLHLARAGKLRQRPLVRDRFLILAGVVASCMNLDGVAAYCRREVLGNNPGHMIRRWPTLAAAMEQVAFDSLLRQLQRRYPREKAEQMLASLGIQMASERKTYYSDEEYAAALLGTTVDVLREASGGTDAP